MAQTITSRAVDVFIDAVRARGGEATTVTKGILTFVEVTAAGTVTTLRVKGTDSDSWQARKSETTVAKAPVTVWALVDLSDGAPIALVSAADYADHVAKLAAAWEGKNPGKALTANTTLAVTADAVAGWEDDWALVGLGSVPSPVPVATPAKKTAAKKAQAKKAPAKKAPAKKAPAKKAAKAAAPTAPAKKTAAKKAPAKKSAPAKAAPAKAAPAKAAPVQAAPAKAAPAKATPAKASEAKITPIATQRESAEPVAIKSVVAARDAVIASKAAQAKADGPAAAAAAPTGTTTAPKKSFLQRIPLLGKLL